MAITTWDGYIGSAKQPLSIVKTGGRTTVAAGWFSLFDVAGNPGAGTLAGSSTTTGTVPTDATAGCPTINAFGGGATGYLAQVDFGSTVACRIKIFDLLWKGGAYAFNAATSGNTPTSYSSRVPGGTDYTDTQIWVETVTAATGNQTWNVTYTNQSGTTGRTTGAVGIGAAPTVGRMWQLPLQSGDTGVQGVTGVTGGTGSAGTANILVLRPLWSGRVKIANDGDVHDLAKTGMPVLYADSALFIAVAADSTAAGVPELELVIANG
jgi:hypothetical protein